MRLPDDPNVLVSSKTADDAGVVRLTDDLALVKTVDFFPPMVDDPTWFGRVGAANSISDIYAMGATPVAAVRVYALPPNLPEHVPAAIIKFERRLAYLSTLGNNAPFIGLFGTVIGVVGAFEALGESAKTPVAEVATQAIAPQAVMTSIAEALVATAIGIAIAIPAVAANNYFQRSTKSTLANTEALSRVLLSHLRADNGNHGEDDDEEEDG